MNEQQGQTGSGLAKTIGIGSLVIIYLQQPREKALGLLLKLDHLGAQLRGIDLNSFDDLLNQVRADGAEEGYGPLLSTLHFPAGRIERILLDEPAGTLPSCGQRFLSSTGIDFADFLRSR